VSRGLRTHWMIGGLAEGGVGLEHETVALDMGRLLALPGEALCAESGGCADGMAGAAVDFTLVAHGAQISLRGSGTAATVNLGVGHGEPRIAVDAQSSAGRALGHAVGGAALQVGELEGRILVALGDHHLAPAGFGSGAGALAGGALGVAALRERCEFLLERFVSGHFAQDLPGTGFGGGKNVLGGGALTNGNGTHRMRAAGHFASLNFTLSYHDCENMRDVRTG